MKLKCLLVSLHSHDPEQIGQFNSESFQEKIFSFLPQLPPEDAEWLSLEKKKTFLLLQVSFTFLGGMYYFFSFLFFWSKQDSTYHLPRLLFVGELLGNL